MKKLTGLMIVLAVLVLGGYYGMGIVTEKTVKSNIKMINQSNGLFAEIEQYKRGWFTSTANIKWRLHLAEHIAKDASGQSQTVPAQDYMMDMPVKIYHGPIIYGNNQVRFGMGYAESNLVVPAQYSTQFDALFSKESVKPYLNLSIFVSYLNKSVVGLSLPKFKLMAKEGNGQFDWMGMKSTSSMSSGMGHVNGSIMIDGVQFSKDDSKVSVGSLTSLYNLHLTSAGLYLGDASFSMPSLDVIVKDKKMVEMKELMISSDSGIDNNLFNMHFNLSLKSVLANGKNYGPGDFEMSLRNLDAEILGKINRQVNTVQNGTDAERQQAVLALLPELPALFNKGAEFEISKLSLTVPQGVVEGNLFVGLPKNDSANPFELIQKVKGNAKLQLPMAAVKQVMMQSLMQQMANQPEMQQALSQQLQSTQQPQAVALTAEQLASMQTDKQLAALEQTGLIIKKDSDYLIEVGLDQGKFTVNGKPFDPSMLKF